KSSRSCAAPFLVRRLRPTLGHIMEASQDIEEERRIATLVLPEDYGRNAGQVASLSTHAILYIKRKELSLKPFELISLPASQCSSIQYEQRLAVVPMVLGGLLVLLLLSAFIFGSVEAGTSIRLGAVALALIFGLNMLFGVKRHRLTFIVDGKRYRWQSKAGDYKYKTAVVERLVAYARERGLLHAAKA
ncbi:hypothetical protein ACFPOE_13550, partial [Caenimonas terrae]